MLRLARVEPDLASTGALGIVLIRILRLMWHAVHIVSAEAIVLLHIARTLDLVLSHIHHGLEQFTLLDIGHAILDAPTILLRQCAIPAELKVETCSGCDRWAINIKRHVVQELGAGFDAGA